MSIDIDLDKLASQPLAAGAIGAVLGLRWAPGASMLDKGINVGGGAAVAGYVGPLVCSYLALTSQSAQAAIGFALGLFGLSMVGAVMDAIKSLQLGDVLKSWLMRR